jgi:hypothetical protein
MLKQAKERERKSKGKVKDHRAELGRQARINGV